MEESSEQCCLGTDVCTPEEHCWLVWGYAPKRSNRKFRCIGHVLAKRPDSINRKTGPTLNRSRASVEVQQSQRQSVSQEIAAEASIRQAHVAWYPLYALLRLAS